jgi:hypothetical protein
MPLRLLGKRTVFWEGGANYRIALNVLAEALPLFYLSASSGDGL